MELVRRLPASNAAPGLAERVVDLATGNRLPAPLASDLRTLTGDLLTEVATRADLDTIELRVCPRPKSVRLEVRGEAQSWELSLPRAVAEDEDTGALVRIDRLADRWGLSHRDGQYCLWAEKFTDPDARPPGDRPKERA
jgi:hypothetical protein